MDVVQHSRFRAGSLPDSPRPRGGGATRPASVSEVPSLQSSHVSESWRDSPALDLVPTQTSLWVWSVPGDWGSRRRQRKNSG